MAKSKKRYKMCTAGVPPHAITSGQVWTFVHTHGGHLLFSCLEHQWTVDHREYHLREMTPVIE